MSTVARPAAQHPGELRQIALATLASPAVDRGIECALPLIASRADGMLVLECAKAMVRAGVAGLALALLETFARSAIESGDATGARFADVVRQLQPQLAKLPSGEVARATLERRWADRREILIERRPDLAPHLPMRLPENAVLYRTLTGNLLFTRRTEQGGCEFLLPFDDAEARAKIIALPQLEETISFCFLGLPSVQLYERVLAHVSSNGHTPSIDIVEPNAALVACWLAALRDDAALRSGRLELFVGPDDRASYQRFLLEHSWRLPATHMLATRRVGTPLQPLDDHFYAPIRAAATARRSQALSVIAERYRGRDRAWWQQRYAEAMQGGPPLRFVGFSSRFSTVMQHVLRGLASAFERRGCRCEAIMEPAAHAVGVDLLGTLSNHAWDGILLINHLRSEYAGVIPPEIPVVSWIQDYMSKTCQREAGNAIGDLDLVLCHAPDVMSSLYGYPIERCLGTSNLTDTSTYDHEPLPEAECAPHRCDVSFAAHGSESPEQLLAIISSAVTPAVAAVLEASLGLIYRELAGKAPVHAHRLVEVMLEAERHVGISGLTPELRRAHLYPQVVRLFDRIFRHQALEWTTHWAESRGRTLAIYGHGWEAHPRFGRFARGPVEGGRSLRALYQASRVSLQVNGHSSLHQRLLDGLASGGFLLCRFNPADWVRVPYATIAAHIRNEGLATLKELVDARERIPALDLACREAERVAGVVIRPVGDPLRDEHVRACARGNNIEALTTDQGLFDTLRSLRLIPERVAGDLPNFGSVCFANEDELHALLDRYVDDPSARSAVAGPMRASVLAHDTYDGLVERILTAFTRERSGA